MILYEKKKVGVFSLKKKLPYEEKNQENKTIFWAVKKEEENKIFFKFLNT